MIEQGTIFKRKINGEYVKDVYCSNGMANIVQCGSHKPTLEQLQAKGYMEYVIQPYNQDTHRLSATETDDGLQCWHIIEEIPVVVPPPLSAEEAALLASLRCQALIELTDRTADEKVCLIIWQPNTTSYMARVDSLHRKTIKYLRARLDNPSPTPEEQLVIDAMAPTQDEEDFVELCDIYQHAAWAIREAARAICVELCQMTVEQINGLADDWVTNHILWP